MEFEVDGGIFYDFHFVDFVDCTVSYSATGCLRSANDADCSGTCMSVNLAGALHVSQLCGVTSRF